MKTKMMRTITMTFALLLVTAIMLVGCTTNAASSEGATPGTSPLSQTTTGGKYDAYSEFGISYEQATDRLLFNGQLIRYFVDSYPVGDEGVAVVADYFNKDGTIDAHAIREFPQSEKDSATFDPSGVLKGVEQYSQEEFDARDIDALMNPAPPSAVAADGESDAARPIQDGDDAVARPVEGGEPETPDEFAELYSVYEPFGVTYDKTQHCMYYNGVKVKTMIDVLSADGTVPEESTSNIRQFNNADGEVRRLYMNWEPWTGCYPASDGCANCYFYGPHAKRYGQRTIERTDKFDWPIRKNKKGEYNIKGDKILATCFATDFFLPEADAWRGEAWVMIKERQDIDFLILTKRIDRFLVSLPADWGDGYDNVNIGCTVENQALTDYRLPLFLSFPIKRRFVACSPLLGPIDLSAYLDGINHVTVSGESGREARVCDYEWVLDIREQCVTAGITFWFKGTGSQFRRDGIVQKINPFQQGNVAKELDITISDGTKWF